MPVTAVAFLKSCLGIFFSLFSFSHFKTAQLHLKLSICEHLQIHILYETCQLADAAKETCLKQECFQGPLIGDLCGLQVSPGSDAEHNCFT